MTLTLDLGPALYSLGRYILFVGVLAYLVREWWILASMRGKR
jgi:type IV secretory pathway TrbL component